MRFRGQEYDGTGVSIAVLDSGINADDPRLAGARIEGWSVQLGATGHALLSGEWHDEHGHGTEVAAAVHRLAPGARILSVRIMDASLRISADLMAAGIETASRAGAGVINLSAGTPNMGKALLLRDCCALAVENGSVILAAAHPRGERAYPADLPETVGTASHPDCPYDKFYHFAPHRFPQTEWLNVSGKFLTYGYDVPRDERTKPSYRGSGIATAYLSARVACLRQALPQAGPADVVEMLKQLALTPVPELGYR